MKHTILALVSTLLALGSALADRPNVIFILADDLGIGGLHCYGTDYIKSPSIDSLATQSMKFTNGIAAYPTCKPSRAAILSGQYGPRTGIYRVRDSYGDENKARLIIPKNHELSPKITNIAKVFKAAGYTTGMFGKWHVSNESITHPRPHFGYDVAYTTHGAHFNAHSNPEVDLPKGMTIEEKYTYMAMDFIEKAHKANKPFYLYMPYFLVHAPFEADADKITAAKQRLKGVSLIKRGSKHLPTVVAMTEMLDSYIGKLLKKVDDLGIADNTIIVFTSDNGSYDPNLVGGFRGKKGDTYDGGMRVPYLFKWNGHIKPNSLSEERIVGVDIYPTLLGLAGLTPPKNHTLDGIDISPLLLGKTAKLPARDIFCCYPKYVRYNERKKRWAYSWRNVIYSGDDKLIQYPEYNETELFDLNTDPKETRNLAKKSPEKNKQLNTKLNAWLKAINAPKPTPNPNYKPSK